MDFACHEHSCSSSSQLQNATTPGLPTPVATAAERHRKRVGPKALNQTRHPVYKGVRRKKGGGKWVSEVREPNKKSRIWLGTFPSPETAAVAHDVAALALRGGRAPLNFPDAAARLPHPHSSSHQDIQRAASEAARDFCPVAPSLIRFSQEQKVVINPSNSNSWGKKDDSVDRSRAESPVSDGDCWSSCSQSATSASDEPGFVDEEAVFNMPALLDSMAEGLLLTPLAMKKGFNWSQYELDDDDEGIEVNLWVD